MQAQTRILLVDDDPILLEVAGSTLRAAGYGVTVARDGAEALTKLASEQFGLVITDLSMPRLDGFGVLRHIRSDPCTRDLPVIVITTNDDPKSVEDAYSAGATTFLTKPLNYPMFGYHIGFVLRGARNEAEIRRIQAAAEAESKRKSELLSVITHEFRTPLHAMVGFSELLKNETKGPLGSNDYKEYAECIFNAADHLNEVVGDISVLSQSVSNMVETKSQRHRVPEIIQAAIAQVAAKADARQIEIMVSSHAGAGISLECDRSMVIKAFGHLLDNAIKFSAAAMPVAVAVETTADGGMAWIVSDRGPGFQASEIDALMEPFVQGEMSRSRTVEGLGVGLAISRVIAQAHGGDLSIEPNPGQGATARLIFPSNRVIPDAEVMQRAAGE